MRPRWSETGAPDGAPEDVVPDWLSTYRLQMAGGMDAPVVPAEPAPLPQTVVLMVMKADATSSDATFAEALVDRTVQFGQPYPAVTHVELWIGDQPGDKLEDNHFSTYLGARRGALWTSGLTDSKKFYSSAAWSAVPICAADVGATRARRVQPALRHALPAGVGALAVPHGPSGRCAPSRVPRTTASTRRRIARRSRRASCATPCPRSS